MDATNALLDELPPSGADLATKDDIGALRADMQTLEQRLDDRIGRPMADGAPR